MIDGVAVSRSWREKVASADQIWTQIKAVLEHYKLEIPAVSRLPDVRLILKNCTDTDLIFRNPACHTDKAEVIPSGKEHSAAMVILGGDTLQAQMQNAQELLDVFNLYSQGLSKAFVAKLPELHENQRIKEAYGPASFEEQSKRLQSVSWTDASGVSVEVKPEIGDSCSFGVRSASQEKAFLTRMNVYVAGTHSTPELMELEGMVIAVSQHWQTGADETRPIVPSVARTFYGASYGSLAVVGIDARNNEVLRIDLGPGRPAFEMVSVYQPVMRLA